MTIAVSNSAVQTVAVNSTITFDTEYLHTGKNCNCPCNSAETHRPNSNSIRLRCPGMYDVHFNGNVTSGTADQQLQLNIMVDGVPATGSTMIETVSAADAYENVSATIPVYVCPGDNVTITVANTGANAITLGADSNLYVYRRGVK